MSTHYNALSIPLRPHGEGATVFWTLWCRKLVLDGGSCLNNKYIIASSMQYNGHGITGVITVCYTDLGQSPLGVNNAGRKGQWN